MKIKISSDGPKMTRLTNVILSYCVLVESEAVLAAKCKSTLIPEEGPLLETLNLFLSLR